MDKIKFESKLRQMFRIVLFLLIASLCNVACKEEESWARPADMSPYIPDYCITTSGSWSISGNMASFNLKPVIRGDFDYWQLKIMSVDYYIDNELVQTEEEEPFSFIYTAVGLDKGIHRLVMKVHIKDLVSGKDITITPSKEFEVTSESSAGASVGLSVQASWSYYGNSVTFNVSSVNISQTLADSGWKINSVNYYFDDKQIETVSKEPYNINHTIKDLKRGEHYLTARAKITNSSNGKETELVSVHEIKIGSGTNFYVEYDQYIKHGEQLIVTPYFLEERSESGCNISSVTYYIDDEKIDTKTTAPFTLTFHLPEDEESHKMNLEILYTDEDNKNHYYLTSFSNIQYMKPDTHECVARIRGNNNLWVGDELSYVAKVYRGENVTGSDEVKVYFDNKFIGESTTFPYTGFYHLTTSDIGTHTLRLEWESYDTHGNLTGKRTQSYGGIIVSE